ncbi:uncharacterized protein LOC134781065 [Penaeus indicus]|uniref:uncharacterized protein LOC134781065 n=1 Tax=Penaeus indicus TaxID=29960 RepID=UPI00300C33E2
MEEAEKNGEVEVYQTFELSDGARTVTILASKEEEERISRDQAYATQRFLSAVGEYHVEEGEEDFNHNATLLLIECIRDRFDKFTSCRQERNQVYREIQEEFRSYGYNLSIEKIRSKWNNLVTTYKRIKERHKAGLAGKRVWDYFQPLDELLSPTYEASGPAGLSLLTGKLEKNEQQSSGSNTFQKISLSPEPSFSPPLACSPVTHTTISIPSTSSTQELKRKHSDSMLGQEQIADRGEKRQEMMEQYFHQMKEKDVKEDEYKRRKEKRDRMKVRALQKIGKELEIIAKTQLDLLKKQDLILEVLQKGSK